MMHSKNLILTCIFCLSVFAIDAQNWTPFSPNTKYFLKKIKKTFTPEEIEATVPHCWRNHTYIEEVDSNYRHYDIVEEKRIKPLLLGRYLLLDLQAGKAWWQHPGSMVIYFHTQPGDSWLLDTLNQIYATHLYDEAVSRYGQPDSLRTILLSSSDTVLLSKNFGIVRYPHTYSFPGANNDLFYFLQSGWEKGNIRHGDVVRSDLDYYFRFEIGDVFEYSLNHIYINFPESTHTRIVRQDTIIDRAIFSSFYVYKIKRREITYVPASLYWQRPRDTLVADTIVWKYISDFQSPWLRTSYLDEPAYWGNQVSPVTVFKTIPCHNTSEKQYGRALAQRTDGYGWLICDPENAPDSLCCVNCYAVPNSTNDIVIRPRLGITSIYNINSYHEYLTAVKYDSVTCGNFTIYPIPPPTPPQDTVEQPEEPEEPQDTSMLIVETSLYPNPFNDHLNIKLATPVDQLILIDMQGRSVWRHKQALPSGDHPLPIPDQLPPGVYTLTALDSDGTRVVKARLVKR